MRRLAALTLTRIEADVIEEFVRHTAALVDRHFIVDLETFDGTTAILDALVAEGLGITVIRPSLGLAIGHDFQILTKMTRKIFSEGDFDYLLLLDADEFVIAKGRDDLESALDTLPPGAHALLRNTMYVPLQSDDATEPRVLARIRHHLRKELSGDQYYKVIVHRSFIESEDSTIALGGHAVYGGSSSELPQIRLGHFAARDIEQIQRKIICGWSMMLALGMKEQQPDYAEHWLEIYERLFSGSTRSNDFYAIGRYYAGTVEEESALDFVDDPLPAVEKRYPTISLSPFTTAIKLSRQLSIAYAQVRPPDD